MSKFYDAQIAAGIEINGYVDIEFGPESIVLDGWFSIKELEFIIKYFNEHKDDPLIEVGL